MDNESLLKNYKLSSYLAYIRACEFEEVATELERRDQTPLAPTVTNAVFACELFLKSALIWETKTVRVKTSHKLEKLFGRLSVNAQNKIIAYAEIYNWNKFFKESSNAFCEWRYIHELEGFKSISILDILRFANAMKKYIEQDIGLTDNNENTSASFIDEFMGAFLDE